MEELLHKAKMRNLALTGVIAIALVAGCLLTACSVSAATSVGDAVSVGSTLAVTGATTLNGAVTLGDAVNDAITVTGRLGTLTISDGSTSTTTLSRTALTINKVLNTYDSGYFNVDASGNVSASGTLAVVGATTFDGAVTLGNAIGDDLTVTGRIASHVLPKTNVTYNLGAYANAWNNVFASGTVYAASSTIYNPSTTSSIYISSAVTNTGGQLILKAGNGTCYAVYIGATPDGNGGIGVTSTALSACY